MDTAAASSRVFKMPELVRMISDNCDPETRARLGLTARCMLETLVSAWTDANETMLLVLAEAIIHGDAQKSRTRVLAYAHAIRTLSLLCPTEEASEKLSLLLMLMAWTSPGKYPTFSRLHTLTVSACTITALTMVSNHPLPSLISLTVHLTGEDDEIYTTPDWTAALRLLLKSRATLSPSLKVLEIFKSELMDWEEVELAETMPWDTLPPLELLTLPSEFVDDAVLTALHRYTPSEKFRVVGPSSGLGAPFVTDQARPFWHVLKDLHLECASDEAVCILGGLHASLATLRIEFSNTTPAVDLTELIRVISVHQLALSSVSLVIRCALGALEESCELKVLQPLHICTRMENFSFAYKVDGKFICNDHDLRNLVKGWARLIHLTIQWNKMVIHQPFDALDQFYAQFSITMPGVASLTVACPYLAHVKLSCVTVFDPLVHPEPLNPETPFALELNDIRGHSELIARVLRDTWPGLRIGLPRKCWMPNGNSPYQKAKKIIRTLEESKARVLERLRAHQEAQQGSSHA